MVSSFSSTIIALLIMLRKAIVSSVFSPKCVVSNPMGLKVQNKTHLLHSLTILLMVFLSLPFLELLS